jgi:uncharacterized protein YndB with AHSA1/START domain
MQNENTDPSGREQRTTVTLDAPVELVWEIWTKADHIKNWWGPNGFTSTIEKLDVQKDGEWTFVMHGPDGSNYPNRTRFREVIPFSKLVHEHFDPNFIAIIEFQRSEDKTILTWYKLYETVELFDLVEKHHKSSEGLKQTIERMKQYLTDQKASAFAVGNATSTRLKESNVNTWKYVGWALVGGIVLGVPAAFLAKLTGLNMLAPMGAAGGAVLFMMNRISHDKKKSDMDRR